MTQQPNGKKPAAPPEPLSREPTGDVAPPLILIEGGEKAGRSWTAAKLTGSERVGRAWWLELGEVTADEYKRVPGSRYKVLEHDGSWGSIVSRVEEVRAWAEWAQQAGEKPVVLVIDQMTAEWELLSAWVDSRARATESVKKLLARDPNAAFKAPQNLWNDANARHRRLMSILRTFPGIVVLIARGKEVTAINEVTGQPISGKRDYRVEAQKSLGYEVRYWIRMHRGQPAYIHAAQSCVPELAIVPGIDEPQELPKDWSLDTLIFDMIGYDPRTPVTQYVPLNPDMTPEQIRDEICDPRTDFDRLGELRNIIITSRYEDVALPNEANEEERLIDLVVRHGKERNPNPPKPAPVTPLPQPATAGNGRRPAA